MFAGMEVGRIVAMLSPVIALQLALAVWCVVKIAREGTSNLNRPLWVVIVILVNFLGPLAFLLVGRRKDV